MEEHKLFLPLDAGEEARPAEVLPATVCDKVITNSITNTPFEFEWDDLLEQEEKQLLRVRTNGEDAGGGTDDGIFTPGGSFYISAVKPPRSPAASPHILSGRKKTREGIATGLKGLHSASQPELFHAYGDKDGPPLSPSFPPRALLRKGSKNSLLSQSFSYGSRSKGYMYDYDSNDDEDEDEMVGIMPSSNKSPSNKPRIRQESSLLLRCASELADKRLLSPGMEEESGSENDVDHNGVGSDDEVNIFGDGLMEGLGTNRHENDDVYIEDCGIGDDAIFDLSLPSGGGFDLHSVTHSKSEKQNLFGGDGGASSFTGGAHATGSTFSFALSSPSSLLSGGGRAVSSSFSAYHSSGGGHGSGGSAYSAHVITDSLDDGDDFDLRAFDLNVPPLSIARDFFDEADDDDDDDDDKYGKGMFYEGSSGSSSRSGFDEVSGRGLTGRLKARYGTLSGSHSRSTDLDSDRHHFDSEDGACNLAPGILDES